MIKKQNQIFLTTLILTDAFMLVVAWLLAYEVRFRVQLLPLIHGMPGWTDYVYILPVILAAYPFAANAAGLYRLAGRRQFFSEIYYAGKTAALIVLLILFATFFIRRFLYSRLVIIYFWIFATFFIAVSRYLLWQLLINVRKKKEYLKGTLVVGTGDLARTLAEKIDFHPELGFNIEGFITVQPEESAEGKLAGRYNIVGELKDIGRIIHEKEINQVFIALPAKLYGKMDEALESLSGEMVDIKVIPDFIQYMRLNAGIDEFEGFPIINLVLSPMFGWNEIYKRWFDVVFSWVAAILFSPLIALIALAIKVTSKGPVFYAQERVGLDGKKFYMYKFRSMYVGAEKGTGPTFAKKKDERTTPLGKILRRFSLDEIPQLYNVIKEEMSLVGPRPERPVFAEDFKKKIPHYMKRHKVKAGMTGWAQVNDWRGDTSIEKRIEYDLYYIEHWSPVFDLKILLQTFWIVFFSKNAY